MSEVPWGSDSEYGRLLDVLLCPPDNFKWGATSVISRATLESDRVFDAELAAAQHREMLAAYEGAGVTVHMLEPDPNLPYQVFARDSSVATPEGGVVTQMAQHWRRGEEWFWDTLVDADEASNPFNWQWVAGSGDDAAPYFRVFNPARQQERFDPDGDYVRRWVPEIGTERRDDPIVDLRDSRRDALAAYEEVRGSPDGV